MPPPILAPVALLVFAGLPPAYAEEPVRAERRARRAIEVEVKGEGATELEARHAAALARDAAYARAIDGLLPMQLTPVPAAAPGLWPGSELRSTRTEQVGDRFVVREVHRLVDPSVFRATHRVEGITLAFRVAPRAGFVVVEPGQDGLYELAAGDVVLGFEAWDGLAGAIRSGQSLSVERASVVTLRAGRWVPPPDPRHRLDEAPTCGPCCHGSADCDRRWEP